MSNDRPDQDDIMNPRTWLYHYDPETDRISFPPGYEDGYRWLKKTLGPFGVDIDRIETEAKLDRIMDTHRDGIMALIDARTMNNKSPSLEVKLAQATHRGDYVEAKRLRNLLKKRKALGLKMARP